MTVMIRTPGEIGQLLEFLDRAYDRRSWHGANLRGSLRGVSAATARRRPAEGRHNIWELVVHAAYWKYAVRRRVTSEERGSFPMRGSNWFARPLDGQATDKAWRQDVALLDDMHASLRAAVARLSVRDLRSTRGGRGEVRLLDLVMGIAAHDIYHAGQVQLLKRLAT